MQDDLYPPGMGPGKCPSPSSPVGKPEKPLPAQRPLSEVNDLLPPGGSVPARSDDNVPDFLEILPDETLPPMADDAPLLMAIPLQPSPLPAIPMAVPLRPADAIAVAGTAVPSATIATATPSTLSIGAAPSAARVANTRHQQSIWFLVLTVVGGVATLVAVGGAFLLLNQRSPREQQEARREAASAAVGWAPPTAIETQPQRPAPVTRQPLAEPTVSPVEAVPSSVPAPVSSAEPVGWAPPTTAELSPQPSVAPELTPPPPVPISPTVTRAEVQQLIKALETARTALGEQNFKLADAQLAKAQSLAKLPNHQAAASRLAAVAGYVKQFREAVKAAASSMQAGESFQVGNSTQVSFVEATADKIVVRIAGSNRTYSFSDLPPGLALALADFKLPGGDATSNIIKGAYLLTHKRADTETQDKARDLWPQAQSAGANITHLLPFLTENYADFLQDASP